MKTLSSIILIYFILFPLSAYAGWIIVDDEEPNKPSSYQLESGQIELRTAQKERPKTKKQQNDKIMYLTFDDGPLLGSDNIITVLQEEEVQATMFMVGKHIDRNKYRKQTYQRALDEPLVMVANHTYSHADGRYKHFYSNSESLLADMKKMNTKLSQTNSDYTLPYCRLAGRNVFRLPGFCCDDPGIPKLWEESEKYDKLQQEGFHLFGWDYQWEYNPNSGEVYNSPEKMVNNIESIHRRGRTKQKGKFVLLMHDFSFRDKFDGKETLRGLIQGLKAKGWSFETLKTYM